MSQLNNTSLNSGNSCNNGMGAILEDFTKDIFSHIGFAVQNHNVWQGGCDVTATLGTLTVNGQCWNWYGGYPHPDRWQSTINQLNGQINILFSYGVKPTSQQYIEAKSKHIHIVHYPKQLDVFDDTKPSMINWLSSKIIEVLSLEGVITINTNIDKSVNQVSYSNSRSVLGLKISGFASWFKGLVCKIKGKHAKSANKSKDSLDNTKGPLDVKNGTMDKEEAEINQNVSAKVEVALGSYQDALSSSLADRLVDRIRNKIECHVCKKVGNRIKFASLIYCDHCIAEMANQESQLRELKRRDDFVRQKWYG